MLPETHWALGWAEAPGLERETSTCILRHVGAVDKSAVFLRGKVSHGPKGTMAEGNGD